MSAGAALRMAALTAALVIPLAALARAPYTAAAADDAVLRLSWRLPAPASESCRARTPEELEALPVHMRTAEVCEREVARYVLITRVGESAADTAALVGAGVRGDRPLFVLEERRLPPGRHRVAIEILRDGSAPEPLAALDTILAIPAGRIRLVTLTGDRLVVR